MLFLYLPFLVCGETINDFLNWNWTFMRITKLQENFDQSMPGMSCQVIRFHFSKADSSSDFCDDSEQFEASFRRRQCDSDESNGAKSAGGGRRHRPVPFFRFPFSETNPLSSNNILNQINYFKFSSVDLAIYSAKRNVAWQSTDGFDDDNDERKSMFFFSLFLSFSLSLSPSLSLHAQMYKFYCLVTVFDKKTFLFLFYFLFLALIYYVSSASIICLRTFFKVCQTFLSIGQAWNKK